MTRQELILELNKQTSRQPAALVMDQHGDKGIATILFENMGHPWNSGDLIVFWSNGDHTDIDGRTDITILQPLFV